MEKKSNFLVFLVIIAILTLIIAALTTFIIIVGINGPASTAEAGDSASYSASYAMAGGIPPDEDSLSTIPLIESGQAINLASDNPAKPSYALIEMSIKYFNKIEGIKDVQAKITLNKANLQEIVTTYFMAMSVEEFSRFETKARVKEELREELNGFLLSTISTDKERRKVGDIIYDVVFSAWNYQ